MVLVDYVSRLPRPGETLPGHRFQVGFGGKGANQCIAAARLGAMTAMVGMVGDDTFGHDYLKNFKEHGVNIDHVGMTKEASTGVAPIAVTDEGVNSIILVSGANLTLSESHVREAESVIARAKVVICQLEISINTTYTALRLAHKHKVTTILNAAPAVKDLDPEIFKYCSIFCVNEIEAELVAGLTVTKVEDAEQAVCELLTRGCETVIITLGDKGSVFATADEPTPVHVPCKKVPAVDTTGAGDSFIGALAFFLAQYPQLPLVDAIQRSSDIASISVQYPGTQSSYPYPSDLPASLFIS